MWSGRPVGAGPPIGRRRSQPPTTPSWSSTASPSPVSQTSLSRPVAPEPHGQAEGLERVLGGRGPAHPGGRSRSGCRARRGVTGHTAHSAAALKRHSTPCRWLPCWRKYRTDWGRETWRRSGQVATTAETWSSRPTTSQVRVCAQDDSGSYVFSLPRLRSVGRQAGRAPDRRPARGLRGGPGRRWRLPAELDERPYFGTRSPTTTSSTSTACSSDDSWFEHAGPGQRRL